MPEQIGRYQVRGEIGQGGMATVFHAYDPRFERDVAVKVLPRLFLHDPQFRARFEWEGRTVASLEHPAIVPVYDYGEEEGQLYLVMRLMAGGSLAERLRRGPLPLPEVARVFDRLAPALDAAHSQGVVHRDLKPANVLFDQWDEPALSDFGIARLMAATGGLVGTPAYMSPEQVRAPRALDGRSDVYALGVMLFQMLSGQLPYENDTPMSLAVMHVMEPVPDVLAAKGDLPPRAQEVVAKAMAKEREERYDTAGALAAAVRDLAHAEPAQYYDCEGRTVTVGSYPDGASWVGALDMAGNVWEWMQDWHDNDYYVNSSAVNPQGPARGEYKALRGGSWFTFSSGGRASNRGDGDPAIWDDDIGFRCAQE